MMTGIGTPSSHNKTARPIVQLPSKCSASDNRFDQIWFRLLAWRNGGMPQRVNSLTPESSEIRQCNLTALQQCCAGGFQL